MQATLRRFRTPEQSWPEVSPLDPYAALFDVRAGSMPYDFLIDTYETERGPMKMAQPNTAPPVEKS